jgi:DNA-binding XRE family transcriptional regulator
LIKLKKQAFDAQMKKKCIKSVAEVAKKIGFSRQRLHQVYNDGAGASLILSKKLAKFFECSFSDLFEYARTEKE